MSIALNVNPPFSVRFVRHSQALLEKLDCHIFLGSIGEAGVCIDLNECLTDTTGLICANGNCRNQEFTGFVCEWWVWGFGMTYHGVRLSRVPFYLINFDPPVGQYSASYPPSQRPWI